MLNAKVFGIKRMEIHDGYGLRTTVFFKGCPLRCLWCHNPEGLNFGTEIAHFENKCVGCLNCVKACRKNALSFTQGKILIDRNRCVLCGACAKECPTDATVIFGKDYTVEELYEEIIKDKPFFDNGGGITLSGGECLQQTEFVIGLSEKLKKSGVSVYIDTCGFVSQRALERILPYTDKFLYDIKAIDEEIHKKCTGQSNKAILENFRFLVEKSAPIEVRYPLIKGYNDGEAEKIGKFIAKLNDEITVKVLQYHNYSGSLYVALGKKNTMPNIATTRADVENAVKTLRKHLKYVLYPTEN